MPSGQRTAVDIRCTDRWRLFTAGFLLARSTRSGPVRQAGAMLSERLYAVGLRGWHLHVLSLASVWLCVGLWIRAKTLGEDERGNGERRALFVGLWAPTLWLIGDSIERQEARRARVWARGRRLRRSRVRLPRS